MASYVVPQVEIHQLFSEIPVALTQNQVPFVFGPNYLLHRYGVESEKLGTYAGEYFFDREQVFARPADDADSAPANDGDSAPANDEDSTPTPVYKYFYPYPNALDAKKIDTSYTKVFADNVVVGLADMGGITRDEQDLNVIYTTGIPENRWDIKEGIDEFIKGRKVYLRVDAAVGEDYSVIATIVDVKTVDNASSSGPAIAKLTLDEEITEGDTITSGYICEVQNNVEIPRNDPSDPTKTAVNWKEDAQAVINGSTGDKEDGISIEQQITVEVMDPDFEQMKYGPVISADIYIEFRELINTASDSIHTLTGASEVADALGAVSPDNPLAMGVYNAALNSGGQIVRYMAVPTNDADGYSKVLNAASLTKEVYFMVPLTRDEAILDLVQSHVNDMSAPKVKRWRIAFVSAEIPDRKAVYTKLNNTDGSDFMAVVTAYSEENDTADLQFVVQDGQDWVPSKDTKFKKDLVVDDVLVTNFNNVEYGEKVPQEFRIVEILSNNRIRVSDPNGYLQNGIRDSVAVTTGKKAEIYHPYTNTQKAEVIRDLSSSFADRRMYNVFPSVFQGSGMTQTGEFAAACVAGLVSSCLPQQPVTNLELVGISDIAETYQTFSTHDLDTMASGGTFIVMQDLPHDQVYVRHQISTDYEANNLNTAELSITKNLDSISFYFDNLLSPYIGKYNITPDLLSVLHNVITGGLNSLEETDYGLYGPQVIADGTEILLLEQDAVLKDHVNCNIKLSMPYPFNHLVLKLFV